MNEKPPVKSYCGGIPNYCIPKVISNVDNVTPQVTSHVDTANIMQEPVDETAKGEHEGGPT